MFCCRYSPPRTCSVSDSGELPKAVAAEETNRDLSPGPEPSTRMNLYITGNCTTPNPRETGVVPANRKQITMISKVKSTY